ncbi:hypothetical protein ACOME3_010469 [Neoechinorhynchus agilis]
MLLKLNEYKAAIARENDSLEDMKRQCVDQQVTQQRLLKEQNELKKSLTEKMKKSEEDAHKVYRSEISKYQNYANTAISNEIERINEIYDQQIERYSRKIEVLRERNCLLKFPNRFEKRVDNDDRTKIDERFKAQEKKLKEFEERNKIMKEIYSEEEEKLMSSFEDKSYKNNLSKNLISPVLNLIKIHENKVASFVDDLQEMGKDLCGLKEERVNLLKKLSQKRQELFCRASHHRHQWLQPD